MLSFFPRTTCVTLCMITETYAVKTLASSSISSVAFVRLLMMWTRALVFNERKGYRVAMWFHLFLCFSFWINRKVKSLKCLIGICELSDSAMELHSFAYITEFFDSKRKYRTSVHSLYHLVWVDFFSVVSPIDCWTNKFAMTNNDCPNSCSLDTN